MCRTGGIITQYHYRYFTGILPPGTAQTQGNGPNLHLEYRRDHPRDNGANLPLDRRRGRSDSGANIQLDRRRDRKDHGTGTGTIKPHGQLNHFVAAPTHLGQWAMAPGTTGSQRGPGSPTARLAPISRALSKVESIVRGPPRETNHLAAHQCLLWRALLYGSAVCRQQIQVEHCG